MLNCQVTVCHDQEASTGPQSALDPSHVPPHIHVRHAPSPLWHHTGGMDLAPGPESSPTLPSASRRGRPQRKTTSVGLLALFIPIFVLSLVFSRGEPLPGMAVVLLLALALSLRFGNARTGANLRAVFARPETTGVVSLLIPAMAISGIFGGPVLMLAVLALAFTGLLLAAFRGGALVQESMPASLRPSAPHTPALPAQPSAELMPALDLRELCRGLPPVLAGEVLATVDRLEAVALQAGEQGDTRRAFDARQGLSEYLPETVRAWKAQQGDERDPDELAQALTLIQRLVGSDTSSKESLRRTWETQQRFLKARTGQSANDTEES